MTALLGRYGGVALDIATILFEPLDEQWAEMVSRGETFRGYAYRVNGRPWDKPQVTVPWFFMSRREGIFSTAVVSQVTSMCTAYLNPVLPLADRIITPILSNLYDMPKCYEDLSVMEQGQCPELSQPLTQDDQAQPIRNDRLVSLSDPRDGPQLPYAMADNASMGLWSISAESPAPGRLAECTSMRECWEVFELRRQQGLLIFVKLFHMGGRLWLKSRQEILLERWTYFYNWLLAAGMSDVQLAMQTGYELPGSGPSSLHARPSVQAGHKLPADEPLPLSASSVR